MAYSETSHGVTLPDTREFILASPETGRDYLIQVALPDGPPPEAGYPVLYVLDGNARLPLVKAARDTLTRHGPGGSGLPLLIVAIGYPDAKRFALERRTEDYTPMVSGRDSNEGEYGGADAFLEFIEAQLKPEIAARFAVDSHREALFGHSFGGLFAVHALMTRPSSFERYIIISPSLWWYGAHPLDTLAERMRRQPQESTLPRVLVGVGGDEQTPSEAERGTPRAKRLRERAMVDHAQAFANWLGARHPDWQLELRRFSGEDHGSVMWPATREALNFLHSP